MLICRDPGRMSEAEAKERLGSACRRIELTKCIGGYAFRLGRGKPREVLEVLDAWTEAGRWWEGEKEANFYRLSLAPAMVAEVMKDPEGGWWLVRLRD